MKKRMTATILAALMVFTGVCTWGGFSVAAETASQNNKNEEIDMILNPAVQGIMFDGFMKERMDNSIDNWVVPVYSANPAMIEMFRQRDTLPRQRIMAWYGEFPGKTLTAAALIYRMTVRQDIRDAMDLLVSDLASVQSPEGYLGPFPISERITGYIHPAMGKSHTWDMWGHYHCIIGLLMWYEATGSDVAYQTAIKAADYIIDFFAQSGQSVLDAGETEMNLSIIDAYTKLYRLTGTEKYLMFANTLLAALEDDTAGDYLRQGLVGTPYYLTKKPRWEGLHTLMSFYDLYLITGDPDYKTALQNLWWSILETDRHNTGGFSSGEKAQGTPYHTGPIETCSTVAWIALTGYMLRLTDSSLVADELEMATFNGVLGYMHPSGRWSAYSSPMEGVKKASAHEIVFQAIAGSPELNCCSVNAPRGLGMISDWAVLNMDDQLTLNYYGAGTIQTTTPGGQAMIISQQTDYPAEGTVSITMNLPRSETFTLRLRIPAWSVQTTLSLNGEELRGAQSGSYYSISRRFADGDTLSLSLDMRLHMWVGEEAFMGSVSLYRGPLLLTYDTHYNAQDAETPPTLRVEALDYTVVQDTGKEPPILLLEFIDVQGKPVLLCDYSSAGVRGTTFNTWIPMQGAPAPVNFSEQIPVWNTQP